MTQCTCLERLGRAMDARQNALRWDKKTDTAITYHLLCQDIRAALPPDARGKP